MKKSPNKMEQTLEFIIKHKIFIYLLSLVAGLATILYFYSEDLFPKLLLIPSKPIFDYVISITGFFLTALGFYFVVLQVSALSKQINNQEEQYHKDSEFKNFLEATKMLTAIENKDNATAQISAMYLLYDYAKKHSKHDNGNLEKVMNILNRYAVPAIYNKKDLIYSYTDNFNKTKNIVDDRQTIIEWKESSAAYQQIASIALELNKQLFAYALKHTTKVNLSNIIIFDFDVERDVDDSINLFDIIKNSPELTFLCCNFSDGSRKIDFATPEKEISKESITGRMNISLSRFINCNLKKCNFSYSNLWGVTFEKCDLIDTIFNHAECEGVNFIETLINIHQINSMLFLSNNNGEFSKFSSVNQRAEQLEYGIIYKEKSSCFRNIYEYEQFKKADLN